MGEQAKKRNTDWRQPAHKVTLQLCGLHATGIFPGLGLVRYKSVAYGVAFPPPPIYIQLCKQFSIDQPV